jgi:hypothetical protein
MPDTPILDAKCRESLAVAFRGSGYTIDDECAPRDIVASPFLPPPSPPRAVPSPPTHHVGEPGRRREAGIEKLLALGMTRADASEAIVVLVKTHRVTAAEAGPGLLNGCYVVYPPPLGDADIRLDPELGLVVFLREGPLDLNTDACARLVDMSMGEPYHDRVKEAMDALKSAKWSPLFIVDFFGPGLAERLGLKDEEELGTTWRKEAAAMKAYAATGVVGQERGEEKHAADSSLLP